MRAIFFYFRNKNHVTHLWQSNVRHLTGSLWNVWNARECILSVIRYSFRMFSFYFTPLGFYQGHRTYISPTYCLLCSLCSLKTISQRKWENFILRHLSWDQTLTNIGSTFLTEKNLEESPDTSNDIHHFDLILICRLHLLVFKLCCWSWKYGISLFLPRPGFWDQIVLGERLPHSHFPVLSNQPCTLTECSIVVEIFVAK